MCVCVHVRSCSQEGVDRLRTNLTGYVAGLVLHPSWTAPYQVRGDAHFVRTGASAFLQPTLSDLLLNRLQA